jgi:hypothetical protein
LEQKRGSFGSIFEKKESDVMKKGRNMAEILGNDGGLDDRELSDGEKGPAAENVRKIT